MEKWDRLSNAFCRDFKVEQAEAELESRWTEKAEKMVAQTEEKWKRRFQEVLDEKEETFKKMAELQEKVTTAYSLSKASCTFFVKLCFQVVYIFFSLLFYFVFSGFDILLCIRELRRCHT